MEHVLGGILQAIGLVMSKSFGAATHALDAYDGRRVRWVTTAAASVASALYVPMVVGAGFGVRAVWREMDSDLMWFIGSIFLFAAFLVLAIALSGVGLGIAVGAWMLVDRPAARWYAGFFAAGGVICAVFVLSMQTWLTRVIGWSTFGLSIALLVLVLIPRSELATADSDFAILPDEPEPEQGVELTQPTAGRRRFVL